MVNGTKGKIEPKESAQTFSLHPYQRTENANKTVIVSATYTYHHRVLLELSSEEP